MRLKTLGGLALEPSGFGRPKPLLLLAYLAVEGAKEKRHLYELFWPEAADPSNSLRVVSKLLREVSPELISTDERTVSTGLESDFAALQVALGNQDGETVSKLYQGGFLAEFSLPDWGSELEEWVYSTREFVASRVQSVLVRAAEAEAAKGAFERAGQWAEKAYRLGRQDPEPEDLERLYALLVAGDHAASGEVRKQAKEYGLELSLSRAEAQGRYRVASAQSSAEPKVTPHNLPRAKTSFIGRDPELIELGQIISRGEVPLITLLGPGGMGKTRLALQLASGQIQENNFPDGVYFVALEALTEPSQVPLALVQTLNLKPSDDPLEAVKAGIARKRMLLVLDNFEHLTEGALLVSELLESCPHLSIIVTSRERLNLEEEHVFSLEGLSLPKGDTFEFASAEYNDAIKLFVQRAKRARLEFALTPENLPQVLSICTFVGGSPLGIELAAVWLRSLPIAEIAREIGKIMDSLEAPTRNLVERHQSLRAVFEHSWKLLKPKEQQTLARLTVFLGGFTREAASAVSEATIPLLTSLVDKSLLRVSPEGRYDFHPLLYGFAREKLEADLVLLENMRRSHLIHFLAFAEAADARMNGPEQARTATLFQAESDNLRSALGFAVGSVQAEAGLRLVIALGQFWEARGHFIEGRQAVRAALALDTSAHPELLTKALNTAGSLSTQSHPEEAAAYYGKALELAQARGNRWAAGVALRGLGRVTGIQGRFAEAQTHLEASLSILRELDDPTQIARTLTNLAINFVYLDQRPKARELFAELLALYRSQQDGRNVARALINLGAVSQELGDFRSAEEHYQECLALVRSLGDAEMEASVTENLASLSERQDDLPGALAHHRAALEIMLRLENAHFALWTLINCAHAYQRLGDFATVLRLAGLIEAQQNRLNIHFPDYHLAVLTEAVEVSTKALGDTQAEALRLEGRKMGLLEVLNLLGQEPAQSPAIKAAARVR